MLPLLTWAMDFKSKENIHLSSFSWSWYTLNKRGWMPSENESKNCKVGFHDYWQKEALTQICLLYKQKDASFNCQLSKLNLGSLSSWVLLSLPSITRNEEEGQTEPSAGLTQSPQTVNLNWPPACIAVSDVQKDSQVMEFFPSLSICSLTFPVQELHHLRPWLDQGKHLHDPWYPNRWICNSVKLDLLVKFGAKS